MPSSATPGRRHRAVKFTNKLFPSGALLGQTGSALMSAPRVALADRRRARGIELQSDAGDVQIVWNARRSVYDASSNTVYRATLPAEAAPQRQRTPPTLADIDPVLTSSAFTARSPGPSRRMSPGSPPTASRSRRSTTAACSGRSSLPGTLRNGAPLRVAIFAQGASSPVLELAVDRHLLWRGRLE